MEGVIDVCYDPQQKHSYTITNFIAAPGCRFYCILIVWNAKYQEYDEHLCEYRCKKCMSSSLCNTENVENIHFPLCYRNFHGEPCYKNHMRTVPHK